MSSWNGQNLIDRDWIATIPSWPESFKYKSMIETAMELSKELRDPKGDHQVDIIIALTHCRVPNVRASLMGMLLTSRISPSQTS